MMNPGACCVGVSPVRSRAPGGMGHTHVSGVDRHAVCSFATQHSRAVSLGTVWPDPGQTDTPCAVLPGWHHCYWNSVERYINVQLEAPSDGQ